MNVQIALIVSISVAFLASYSRIGAQEVSTELTDFMTWHSLPDLPDSLGVAGPYAGVHNEALIVAGGANFPRPVWKSSKVYQDRIHVLFKVGNTFEWKDGGRLPSPTAYGAAVSTKDGVVCMGGNDLSATFDNVFLLSWDDAAKRITSTEYPSLPSPCAYGAATSIGDIIYLAGGQSDQSLETAMTNLWSLDLSRKGKEGFEWKKLPPCPGPSRALNLTVNQHNGETDCVYVISGRRQTGPAEDPASFGFLTDVWEFTPTTNRWRQRRDAPRCVMAGTSISFKQDEILVLGGANDELFFKANELKDSHPGFVKKSLAFNTIANTWRDAGSIPANHVTTLAVRWGKDIIIPSGETRPRVRSPKIYRITLD